MAIADILRGFRDLKQERTVRDYLVFGLVAAMLHMRPFFTRDVDIGVATESDEEFWRIFNRLADFGKVDGHSVVIQGTPVEIFPVDISPIIQDGLIHANRKRVETVLVKIASPEHPLLESLRVYRRQDKGQVVRHAGTLLLRVLNALWEELLGPGQRRLLPADWGSGQQKGLSRDHTGTVRGAGIEWSCLKRPVTAFPPALTSPLVSGGLSGGLPNSLISGPCPINGIQGNQGR